MLKPGVVLAIDVLLRGFSDTSRINPALPMSQAKQRNRGIVFAGPDEHAPVFRIAADAPDHGRIELPECEEARKHSIVSHKPAKRELPCETIDKG